MNKRNYQQAKRQKDDARKTRQLQKLQRRGERDSSADVSLDVEPSVGSESSAPVSVPATR